MPGQHTETFNVWFFYPDGTNTCERQGITAQAAVEFAAQAIRRPAAQIGILNQVMITDQGDCCNWHWKFREGVVFPPQGEKHVEGN